MMLLRSVGRTFREERGRVSPVLLQMDEQLADERDASTLHYPTLGHLYGTL